MPLMLVVESNNHARIMEGWWGFERSCRCGWLLGLVTKMPCVVLAALGSYGGPRDDDWRPGACREGHGFCSLVWDARFTVLAQV